MAHIRWVKLRKREAWKSPRKATPDQILIASSPAGDRPAPAAIWRRLTASGYLIFRPLFGPLAHQMADAVLAIHIVGWKCLPEAAKLS